MHVQFDTPYMLLLQLDFFMGLNMQISLVIFDPINGRLPKLNKLFSMIIKRENTLNPKKIKTDNQFLLLLLFKFVFYLVIFKILCFS